MKKSFLPLIIIALVLFGIYNRAVGFNNTAVLSMKQMQKLHGLM